MFVQREPDTFCRLFARERLKVKLLKKLGLVNKENGHHE